MRRSSSIFSFKFLWLLLPLAGWLATDAWLRSGRGPREFLSFYSDVAFDNPLQIQFKISGAAHEPGKKLVLILGSSIARESLAEKELEKMLGASVQVLNLGFFHARSVDLWMLTPEIRRLKPDLIVMPMVAGESLLEYSYSLTMPYYFNWNIFEILGVNEVVSHSREFLQAALARFSFSFRYRDSISSALMRHAKATLGIEPWVNRGEYRFDREVEVLPPLDHKLSLFGQDFSPGKELVLKASDAFLAEQAKAGVPVVVLVMPYHPKFVPELERVGRQEMIEWQRRGFPQELERWGAISHVSILAPPPGLLKPANFADYLHLNSSGRPVLSGWLAAWIKQRGILESSH